MMMKKNNLCPTVSLWKNISDDDLMIDTYLASAPTLLLQFFPFPTRPHSYSRWKTSNNKKKEERKKGIDII
jgi:hypothetical protein